MKPKTRARTMWLLGATLVAYAMFNVIVFYTTDSFGPVWFAVSLAIYSAILVLTLVLAFSDPGEDEPSLEARSRSRTAIREAPSSDA